MAGCAIIVSGLPQHWNLLDLVIIGTFGPLFGWAASFGYESM
jgi:hypothetical protein